jgi:hypothetical protein
MRPLLRTALASIGCAVLAACSDEPTSASRTPAVPRPSLETASSLALQVITGCDANVIKTIARRYANKSNDPLLTIIGDLGSAVRFGVNPTGNDKAFDALARIAAIRGTPAQKPGVTGAAFDSLVKRVIGCMEPKVYAGVEEPNPPTTGGGGGFKQALGDGWVFEVRGKPTGTYADSAGPAFERTIDATPDTWWAVDKVPGNTWATSINSTLTDCDGSPTVDTCDRVLIFGWRTQTFIESNARAGSSFEHRTLPKLNKSADPNTYFALAVDIGLCFADGTDVTTTQRVNHNSKFLALASTIDCNSYPTAITPTTGSLAFGALNPMRLAQRAAGFFGPQPLYAAAMFDGGSITGRPDDFSPSAVIDLSQVKLVFDPIEDSFVDSVLTSKTTPAHEVRVYAYSLDNTPIPGVNVVVRIAGNSSTISAFGGTSPNDSTVIYSDRVVAKGTPLGYARLTGVTLKKAGGYTLSAEVDVANFTSTPFNSLSFNIQNK